MRRVGNSRLSRFAVGMIGMAVLAVGTYFAFVKDIPFTRPYEMTAVFDNASAVQLNSPVRIAGVDVGKVSKVEPLGKGADSTLSAVTMKITKDGLPIHKDAQLKIRPRIFLEGNFFVDLRPGTPGAPDLADGGSIGPSQTAASVQLDQVLGTLKTSARQDLQKLLIGYGNAISGKPTPGEDSTQDPDVRGKTAGEALNESLGYAPDALRQTAIVNRAFLGTDPGDLAKLIKGGQQTAAALARNEENLKGFVTNFNTTAGALADESAGLRSTVRLLPQVLDAANPAFDNLNRAFPPTRAFAREILPGVRETPATIEASLPWIAQTRALVSPQELGGLVGDLRPAVRGLATFTDGTVKFLPQVDRFNRCVTNDLVPTGDSKISDGQFSTGLSSSSEFFASLIGLADESQNFDGNGNYVRFAAGGGGTPVASAPVNGKQRVFANFIGKPLGTRPARPSSAPPKQRTKPCYAQKRPNLNSAKTGNGP